MNHDSAVNEAKCSNDLSKKAVNNEKNKKDSASQEASVQVTKPVLGALAL